MEIGSIPGIRILPSIKEPAGDFTMPSVLGIDAIARPGDGQEQGSEKKGASAEENDEDALTLEGETEPNHSGTDEAQPPKQVDYFV